MTTRKATKSDEGDDSKRDGKATLPLQHTGLTSTGVATASLCAATPTSVPRPELLRVLGLPRGGEKKPCAKSPAQRLQQRDLLVGPHSLGDHLHAQVARQVDDGADDLAVLAARPMRRTNERPP